MPRGKHRTLEEQIADVNQQISKLTELKKNLEEQKRQEDVQKLLDAAKKSGLTPEELVQKLSEKV
jgi:septal ring factor EnvC (AmiA/AmiB activator)